METPPDPDAIARAFMEAELDKDRPKPVEVSATPARVQTPESTASGTSQSEVDAYIASLDAQVTDSNLLTPFTKPNKRRAEELSQPFDLSGGGSRSETSVPTTPGRDRSAEAQLAADAEPFKFALPRLGKDKSVRYQASDGSVYEITKKSGGYRISKSGDGFATISSISRTEILKRGQAERWVVVDSGHSEATTAAPAATITLSIDSPQPPAAPEAVTPKSTERVDIAPKPAVDPFGVAAVVTDDTIQAEGVSVEAPFVFPTPGGAVMYRRAKGDIAVTKQGDLYIVSDKTGFFNLSESSLVELAKRERWVFVGTKRESSPFGLAPMESDDSHPERPAQHIENRESTNDAVIAKLREEVASERAAFIAVEESQRSAWKNLTRIFRGLSHKDSDDAELMKYRAFYDEKILALQNAELERLKRSGKTIKELRPEMAALIREFEFDEAERIYDIRQEMRLAKTNQPLLEKMRTLWAEAKEGINGPTAKGEVKAWIKLFAGATGVAGSSLIQGIEKGGATYNKLMRSKAGKLILAASVGTAAVGIATGGVGTAAVGFLALKRLAAGAGVAVTLEDVSERVARTRREKRRANVEQDHEARFDAMESEEDLEIKLGNKQEIDFSKLEKYLKEVSAKTRRGEGARRRNELFRKSGAIFAGAVLGSGAATHFTNEYIGGASRAHAAGAAPVEGGIPTDSPSVGPSIDESSAVPESLRDTRAIPSPAEAEVPESLRDTRTIPAPDAIPEESTRGFLGSHEVKRGESIWKLSIKSVQDIPDMDERASERFAKLVELRLAEKLEASPELARSAGFVADADGKFSSHQIQAGAQLELGKLFSQDDLAKLVEEAKGTGSISDVSVPAPDTPIRETVSPIPHQSQTPVLSEAELIAREEARIAERIPSISADERGAIIAAFPESPTTELIKPDGNVMKYVESLSKEDQEKLFRHFRRVSTDLFQTNDVMGGEVYDMHYDPAVHPELAKTKLTAIFADHKLLAKNPFVGYDRLKNPLHWSQMEEVVKFAKASAKAFGASVAEPRVTESVQEYALRMIAIARNQGVKIPGFRVLD